MRYNPKTFCEVSKGLEPKEYATGTHNTLDTEEFDNSNQYSSLLFIPYLGVLEATTTVVLSVIHRDLTADAWAIATDVDGNAITIPSVAVGGDQSLQLMGYRSELFKKQVGLRAVVATDTAVLGGVIVGLGPTDSARITAANYKKAG